MESSSNLAALQWNQGGVLASLQCSGWIIFHIACYPDSESLLHYGSYIVLPNIYFIVMLKDFCMSTYGSVELWVTYRDEYSSRGPVLVFAFQHPQGKVNYVRKSILR